MTFGIVFPSPREVDRYLYALKEKAMTFGIVFPAPLEVDRYLYGDERRPDQISCAEQFPAPREVNRFLYGAG